MRYRKEFFELQVRFAGRAAEIAGYSLDRAILLYTNVYVRLGIGRGFDQAHPVWRAYVDGLVRSTEPGAWTFEFCASRPPDEPEGLVAAFGCFSYAREATGRLRLHFENREPAGVSPLATERIAARRAELDALVAHARKTQPYASQVHGVSWLYNLPAYRRLFPASYLASATVADGRLRNMPLWGQFVDRDGGVRDIPARTLLDRVGRLSGVDGLIDCFPLKPLALEAPLAAFPQALP